MITLRAAVVAALVAAFYGPDLLACGDKFLVPGRGTRYQRTPAERQASAVLVYAPPASSLSGALEALQIERSIRKAGYRPTIVMVPADLASVAAARWDVVVFDATDGQTVRDRLPAAGLAHLLAVTPKVSGVEFALLRTQFFLLLRAPSRAQDFLDAVDDAAVCARFDRIKARKPQ